MTARLLRGIATDVVGAPRAFPWVTHRLVRSDHAGSYALARLTDSKT